MTLIPLDKFGWLKDGKGYQLRDGHICRLGGKEVEISQRDLSSAHIEYSKVLDDKSALKFINQYGFLGLDGRREKLQMRPGYLFQKSWKESVFEITSEAKKVADLMNATAGFWFAKEKYNKKQKALSQKTRKGVRYFKLITPLIDAWNARMNPELLLSYDISETDEVRPVFFPKTLLDFIQIKAGPMVETVITRNCQACGKTLVIDTSDGTKRRQNYCDKKCRNAGNYEDRKNRIKS